jgi:antirestriction protein ArdC
MAKSKGYTDNRWVTYKQLEDRGWHFKTDEVGNSLGKGAGVTVEFFELRDKDTNCAFDKSVLDGMSAEEKQSYMSNNVFPLRKYYRVFNGDIIDGIPKIEFNNIDESSINNRVENILSYWNDNQAKIIYGGNEAFYYVDKDEIHLPKRELFLDMQEFYSTALHEVGHSTGHESRLNRQLGKKYGNQNYALEELRAEIASLFMQQELGVCVSDKEIKNDSAYIKDWISVIEENPNALFTAIADADKITRFVLASEKKSELSGELSKKTDEDNNTEYILPSLAVSSSIEYSKAVDMSERGVDSLTRMVDREVVERAMRAKNADKFIKLYNGESVFGNEERDECALMARIAVFCKDDENKIMRVFKSSGQYRDEKPNSYYMAMIKNSIKYISDIKAKESTSAITKNGTSKSHLLFNAKR